jgi:hypothetical protein
LRAKELCMSFLRMSAPRLMSLSRVLLAENLHVLSRDAVN